MAEMLRPNDVLDYELRALHDESIRPLLDLALDLQAKVAELEEEIELQEERENMREMRAEDLGCIDDGDGGLYIPPDMRPPRRHTITRKE